MFSPKLKQALLTATLLLALPGGVRAQQASGAPGGSAQQIPAEVRGWLRELDQIQNRLESIQAKAMQDPAIGAAQEALGASIKAAMEKADPTLKQAMARAQALEQEAEAAQQKKDQAKLRALEAEAEAIQKKFFAAQRKALDERGLVERINAFQAQLGKKMLEVDPQVRELVARAQALEQKLSAAAAEAGAPR